MRKYLFPSIHHRPLTHIDFQLEFVLILVEGPLNFCCMYCMAKMDHNQSRATRPIFHFGFLSPSFVDHMRRGYMFLGINHFY